MSLYFDLDNLVEPDSQILAERMQMYPFSFKELTVSHSCSFSQETREVPSHRFTNLTPQAILNLAFIPASTAWSPGPNVWGKCLVVS